MKFNAYQNNIVEFLSIRTIIAVHGEGLQVVIFRKGVEQPIVITKREKV